ncbi:phage adaptor protein [Halomonas sp. V046]|uniref:phage adaptor protein n=1 Tax=Halomonas sp. V046 TaxID=3459611 RepID=UPI0040445844
MNFLQLCKRLRQEVGAAGDGPAAVTGQHGEYQRLIDWVRQAWLEIQQEQDEWRFNWAQASIELDADFREYSPPVDLDRWDRSTLRVNGRPLREVAWSVFRDWYREDSEREWPTDITRLPNGNLRMDSSPAQLSWLTFEYWRTPQQLVANIDQPRMPSQYHMVIVYRAMLAYALYENAPEVATAARAGETKITAEMMRRELPAVEIGGPLV